jgi:hypothetical protein
VRITLFGLAAIAIIGAIIVFVGPLFISTESTTGYRLRVSGPVQVSLFPSAQARPQRPSRSQSR